MASSPTMWQPKQISLGLNWKDFLKLVIDIEQLSLLSYRVWRSPCVQGRGELWVCEMGRCWAVATAWHSAAGYWYLLQAVASADMGRASHDFNYKSHGKSLITVEEEPESKGWWVRSLSITNLRPWSFATGQTFQECCILSCLQHHRLNNWISSWHWKHPQRFLCSVSMMFHYLKVFWETCVSRAVPNLKDFPKEISPFCELFPELLLEQICFRTNKMVWLFVKT